MSAELFRDFAVVLLAGGAVALLFYYLKQPVVLGYLLAGFLVGPYSWGPSFVNDAEVMAFLGELGIVFLLFALGLEFNLRKLRKVGATAIIAGTIEIAIMLALGYGAGRLLGWGQLESIFLGAVISISSTTVIVKVLAERGEKDEEWAQTAFGILIIEDVLAVLILTALSGASATGNFAPESLVPLLYKLGIFLGAALLLGLLAGPRIVDRLAFVKVEEVMVILATGLGMGMALLAASLGFSAGLGAFIAGALMAESPRVGKLVHKIEPVRDIFTAIFFVTVGAALDPAALALNWGAVLLLTAVVVGGKIVGVTIATFVTGARPGKALRVGMTLAQIGEFGFIIAALGVSTGAASPSLYAVAIAVSAITSFLTPYLIQASPRAIAMLQRRLPAGVAAYARAYGGWVQRVGRSDRADPEWRRIRRNGTMASLNAAVIVGLFLAGAALSQQLHGEMRARLGMENLALGAQWIVVSILATPFAFMWVREMRQVIEGLARVAVPERLRGAAPTTTERLLRRTFGLAATIGTAAFCVVFGSLVVDNVLYVLAVATVSVAIGSLVLGSSLRRFHAEVESTIGRMTAGEEGAATTRQEAMTLVAQSSAWGAASREVALPEVSGGGGRSIGELRLRELTGASVVSISRSGAGALLSPGPEARLAAGDRVMLVGEAEALLRAAEILLGQDLGIDGGATEIALGSSYAGRALREVPLDESITALVVRRAGVALAADPALRLQDGDVLVVSGPDATVAQAIAALSRA